MSTVFSKSVSVHPGVSAELLQPFHLSQPFSPAANREEDAYERILSVYGEAAGAGGREPIVIVTKEMTRNLADPEALQRLDAVSANHVVTIRNPLLAIESTLGLYLNFMEEFPEGLTQTAKTFARRNQHEFTPEYLRNFLNVYAKHQGFTDGSGLRRHWGALADYARGHRDYRAIGELLEEFFPFYDLNSQLEGVRLGYIAAMNDKTAQQAGHLSLDAFAKSTGHRNWKDLRNKVLEKKVPQETLFPLLDKVFATSNTGWQGLHNMLSQFDNNKRIRIVDGSILRADPKFTLAAVCRHLGLDDQCTDVMTDWADTIKLSPVSHLGATYKAVHARARNSRKLELPTETPVSPSRFPQQFREHLSDVAMPVYLQALTDERCIRPRGKEALSVLLEKQLEDGRPLRDVDPVWAYSLISTDNVIAPKERQEMQEKLREKHEAVWGEMFDLIDRINKDRVMKKVKDSGRVFPGI